jgi:hypothetical protein
LRIVPIADEAARSADEDAAFLAIGGFSALLGADGEDEARIGKTDGAELIEA